MRRVLAASAAFFMLSIALPTSSAAAEAGSCPAVAAHRTLMLERPENTLPGIQAVPATGADTVEMDVQWTSNGFPVLMHDATIDRTTSGPKVAVATLSLAQISAYSAADFEPWNTWPSLRGFTSDGRPVTGVPYAGDFMRVTAAAGLRVLLDVHAAPTELGMQRLQIYLDRNAMTDRTLIMGTPAWVTSMRGWQPDLHYGVIEYNAASTIRRGDWLAGLGAEAYIVPARDVTPAAVTYWHAAGLTVWAWSSDGPTEDVRATWLRLSAARVDHLITNQPAAALDAYVDVCAGN